MPETVRSASCPDKYHVCYAPLLQSPAVYMYAALPVSTHINECLFQNLVEGRTCGNATTNPNNAAITGHAPFHQPLTRSISLVHSTCLCFHLYYGKPPRTVRGQQTTASCIHRRRHDVHRGVLRNPAAGAGHQVRGGPTVADAGEHTCSLWSAYLTPFQANPDAKVPSVLMYDQTGKPQVRRILRH
jgi:hypothetical protein